VKKFIANRIWIVGPVPRGRREGRDMKEQDVNMSKRGYQEDEVHEGNARVINKGNAVT
jgi:hypothetical protein